jgi:hypothetical protein
MGFGTGTGGSDVGGFWVAAYRYLVCKSFA